MTTEEHAHKIQNDGYFEVGGKKIRIPSKYYQSKIAEISNKMEFDESKLTDNQEGMQYALMINSKYAWEMTQIVGCILYGRNKLYNMFTRPLSYLYRRFKTKQLFHELSNEYIALVFVNYIHAIGIGNFLTAMRYIQLMTAQKESQVAK